MAKRKRVWNQEVYESYIHAGRGQGEGTSYSPWISIHDFSSRGISSRIFSYKTNRVHHFLSRNELRFFYLLEWSEFVIDIREQFPLIDVELAVDIAQRADIRYPRDNVSGFPYILTCDFMITTTSGLKARTIKSVADLKNKRTLEKLEIERRYWAMMDIDWRIVTELEIDVQKARHAEWLYTAAVLPTHLADAKYREAIMMQIESTPVHQIALWFDAQFEFPTGSGLCLVKHLLWHKKVTANVGNIAKVMGKRVSGL